MTPTRITGVALIPLNLPMRQPFVTALGEKRVSQNLLVAIRLADGNIGYGEASSSLAWPSETQAAMTGALRRLTGRLIGADIRSAPRLVAEAWESTSEHPTAVSALECALLDAFTRAKGVPLWRWIAAGRSARPVTTGLTISAWNSEEAGRTARAAVIWGFRHLKVKVTGADLDEDIRRVTAVHKAAPRSTLLVDANQGFTVEEAIRFALFVRQHRLPVRLLEQPVRREDREGLAKVQREAGIPVAADESARTIAETSDLIRKRTVPVINIKLAKSGLLGALKITRLAKAAGIRLMIGCMAESALGLSPSVHLACGSGAFSFIDLDSHLLVVSPPCIPGFRARGPRLAVHPSRPGSGSQFPAPVS